MNKTELVKRIAEKTDKKQTDVAAILNAFTDVVGEELQAGNKVAIVGFGTFEARERAARQGRNPRNPEQIIDIPASKAPAFKAGKALKEKVNE